MRLDARKLGFGALLLIIVLLVGAVGLRFALFAYSPYNPSVTAEPQSVIIEVRKGQSPRALTQLLQSRQVISDSSHFFWLGRIVGFWPKVKAGEYEVSPSMTPIEIFSIITSGISVNHPITVREGENMYEIATAIEAKGLSTRQRILELCRNTEFIASLNFQGARPRSLEGYLFPDTYFLNRSMSAEEMLRQMVRRFQALWGPAQEARARSIGMSRHEVLTLASMIEKETGAPQERPLISSVFHNRLRKRMRLQSDPTTIYGIWERYNGNIRKADLQEPTPYNTYTIPALPAGPIANPGKEAIDAALYPAESDFLFFVSQNDGTHVFTRSVEEHYAAVRKFQLDPRARQGKSWRDLKQKSGATTAN